MAGFGKIALVGEYFNQRIVNVLHFRSDNWLPGGGNPFDDVLGWIDAVRTHCQAALLACLPSDYTLRTYEGVAYDDQYNIVTSSPLIRQENTTGLLNATNGMGAAQCAIVSLRCGDQHQINGAGMSKRNRGYLAVGPMGETYVDNYSHLAGNMGNLLNAFAQTLDDTIVVPVELTNLIPIRIHEKWSTTLGIKHLDFRTYSDVLGYRVNAVCSYRRSRKPEA